MSLGEDNGVIDGGDVAGGEYERLGASVSEASILSVLSTIACGTFENQMSNGRREIKWIPPTSSKTTATSR